jgi:hypothetical protein
MANNHRLADTYTLDSLGNPSLTLGTLGSYYRTLFTYPDPAGVAQSGDWIDEPNTHSDDGAALHSGGYGFADQIYGHAVRDSTGKLWLQYWFFYYYNNGFLGIDDHEGDWEMVQVGLDSQQQPDQIVFAEHNYASKCAAGQYETIPGNPHGAPIVYSGLGGHASYPHAGTWRTDTPHNDSVDPDLSSVPAVNPSMQIINNGNPSWADWPGRWGGSGASPPGPGFHSQWTDPAGFAANAGGCTDRYEPVILARARTRATWRLPSAASKPMQLTKARFNHGQLHVSYRSAALRHRKPRWPRMLLSVDAKNDKRPPISEVIAPVLRHGKFTFPERLNRHRHWVVRASLFTPKARSPIVSRPVNRR